MKDQSGQPISDGSVGLFIENTGALFLNYFDRYAETSDDAALTAAVATLRAAAFSQRRALGIRNASDEKLARIMRGRIVSSSRSTKLLSRPSITSSAKATSSKVSEPA